MKLLPEVPTDLSGLISALKCQRQVDADGVECGVSRQAVDEAVAFLERVAAAPDVNDEPVAWQYRNTNGTNEWRYCFGPAEYAERSKQDGCEVRELFARPSPRIAALEAEAVRLRDVAAKLHEYLCSTPQKDFDIPDGVWVPFVKELVK